MLKGEAMKYIKIIVIVLIILFGCCCMSYKKTDFLEVNKKMTFYEFNNAYSDKFSSIISITLDGVEYKYLRMEFSPAYRIEFHIIYPDYYKFPYFFIFRDERYLYSGFLYEMRLHDNLIYRRLADLISQKEEECY